MSRKSPRPKLFTHEQLIAYILGELQQEGECWVWPHAHNGVGYGVTRAYGKNQLCHRLICDYFHGFTDSKHHALHTCDNPRCCNPAHLFPGSRSHNMQDMHAKNRGRAKITAEDAKAIRCLLGTGLTQAQIASRFGIGQVQVSLIKRNKTWVQD